jgi:hypothetical protein
VSVSQELLEKNINAAIELVAWFAGELRKKELEEFRKQKLLILKGSNPVQ